MSECDRCHNAPWTRRWDGDGRVWYLCDDCWVDVVLNRVKAKAPEAAPGDMSQPRPPTPVTGWYPTP